jgi:hypothetical protein
MKDTSGLSEKIGLNPTWVFLRRVWNAENAEYGGVEWSPDKKVWHRSQCRANAISLRYVGGPRDGEVES